MFTNENGLLEPNSDLIAMALAVVGFIIFVFLITHTYQIYQEKTYIAQHYDDAASLAEMLIKNPAFTAPDRSDLIDAARIEALGPEDIQELKERYGTRYDFSFKIEGPPSYRKVVGSSPDMGVSASVPVTIRLNEANEIPGTFTVKIWEK